MKRSAGEAQRKLELELGPIAPWHAYVRVHSITTNHGRKTILPYDYMFEVATEWTGPPAPGFPPSDRPVTGHDLYVTEHEHLARTVARMAARELSQGGEHPPDLRDLAGQIRGRE